jgi:MerR family transcriptional regulator, copper efflux regulator
MNVNQAAKLTGLPSKTLRYYEEVGLVSPARAANGYRVYNERDVQKLAFIANARSLGFSLEECRRLLSLYEDPTRTSGQVKSIAQGQLKIMDVKLRELLAMRRELRRLISSCNGDDRPDCPIVEGLAQRIATIPEEG